MTQESDSGLSTSPVEVSLSRLGQIAVTARDLPAMKAFYRDVLRLPHLFDAPPGLSFFDCAGVRLMLAAPEGAGDEPPARASVLYFTVPDIAIAHAVLAARGAAFEGPPHVVHRAPGYELWMAFLRDPDGNLVGIMSELKG